MPNGKPGVVEWPDPLVIQLERSEIRGTQVAFLEVEGDFVLEMAIIPSDTRSAISVLSWDKLSRRGMIPRHVTADHCPLRSLRLSGQSIPDLDVEINAALRDIDGVLGWDVFGNYRDMGFDDELQCFILSR
jgi:hypothetical protein